MEAAQEEFDNVTAVNPDWVCSVSSLQFKQAQEGDDYGAMYNLENQTMLLNLSGDWNAPLADPYSENYERNRAILRSPIHHEFGHVVVENFMTEEEWSTYADISWDKVADCEADGAHLTLEQCWSLTDGAIREDFLGGNYDGVELPYGAHSAAEDIAEGFSVVLPDIMATHSAFLFDTSYVADEYADSYTAQALAKWESLQKFILNQAGLEEDSGRRGADLSPGSISPSRLSNE
jgi:hypothetical protein